MLTIRHLTLFVPLLLAGCESRPTPKPVRVPAVTDLPKSEYVATAAPPAVTSPVPRLVYAPVVNTVTSPALRPFEDWTEQQAAADALGRIGPPAVPQLVQALRNHDPKVRKEAAEVLARMGSDARPAVPDLVRLLDDEDESIRKTAARTLGRIGPDAAPAIPALMRTLLQPDPLPPNNNLQR